MSEFFTENEYRTTSPLAIVGVMFFSANNPPCCFFDHDALLPDSMRKLVENVLSLEPGMTTKEGASQVLHISSNWTVPVELGVRKRSSLPPLP